MFILIFSNMSNSIEITSPTKYQSLSYNHIHNLSDITIEKGFSFKLILDVKYVLFSC